MAYLSEKESLEHRPTTASGYEREKEAQAVHQASRAKSAASPWLNGIILWAALAVFSNAYNVAIIASSLGQPTFQERFGFATRANILSLISSAVGGNQVGGFFGQFIMAWVSDTYGRKRAIGISAIVLIIGVALGGGCADGNWPMFIAARTIVGIGGWPLASLALTYQSEVAVAELRGWLVGTVGLALGSGYATSSWVGFGLFYYNATFAWRLPLILGLIFPLATLALFPFDKLTALHLNFADVSALPETPRWLCLNGRADEAYKIIERMHANAIDPNHVYAKQEFAQVKAQAAYDATQDSSWLHIARKPSLRKRALINVLVAVASSVTAIQVLTSYLPAILAGFGFSPRNSLLISAGWVTIAAIEPVMCMAVLDKIGRRPLICASSILCAISMSCITALAKYYGSELGITAGGGALIAFIYLHIVFYLLCEAASYVLYVEIWPSHLRAKGAAIGLASIQLTAVWLVWATPYALANITWRYYIVFAVLCAVAFVLQVALVPETKNLPLEEIADLFGDKDDVVMHLSDVKRLAMQEEAQLEH